LGIPELSILTKQNIVDTRALDDSNVVVNDSIISISISVVTHIVAFSLTLLRFYGKGNEKVAMNFLAFVVGNDNDALYVCKEGRIGNSVSAIVLIVSESSGKEEVVICCVASLLSSIHCRTGYN